MLSGIPFAAQQVNLSDGLYYASYATSSHKSTLFPVLQAGPVMVAGALAALATSGLGNYLRPSEEAEKAGKSSAPAPATPDPPAPGKR